MRTDPAHNLQNFRLIGPAVAKRSFGSARMELIGCDAVLPDKCRSSVFRRRPTTMVLVHLVWVLTAQFRTADHRALVQGVSATISSKEITVCNAMEGKDVP